jgi:hypothetical protein
MVKSFFIVIIPRSVIVWDVRAERAQLICFCKVRPDEIRERFRGSGFWVQSATKIGGEGFMSNAVKSAPVKQEKIRVLSRLNERN